MPSLTNPSPPSLLASFLHRRAGVCDVSTGANCITSTTTSTYTTSLSVGATIAIVLGIFGAISFLVLLCIFLGRRASRQDRKAAARGTVTYLGEEAGAGPKRVKFGGPVEPPAYYDVWLTDAAGGLGGEEAERRRRERENEELAGREALAVADAADGGRREVEEV